MWWSRDTVSSCIARSVPSSRIPVSSYRRAAIVSKRRARRGRLSVVTLASPSKQSAINSRCPKEWARKRPSLSRRQAALSGRWFTEKYYDCFTLWPGRRQASTFFSYQQQLNKIWDAVEGRNVGVSPKRILPPSSTTDVGFSKKIRELERLRRDELISDEECEKKKRSILGVCEGRVVCVGLRSAKPAAPLGEDALLPGASQVVALPGQLVQRIECFARH